MARQNIGSGRPWEAIVGYSRAVRVGQIIYVAGTTGVDASGVVVGASDPGAQTTQALRIIEAALAELGASMRDVVRTRIYVTNIANWEAIGNKAAILAAHPDLADLFKAVGAAPAGQRQATAQAYLKQHPDVRTELRQIRQQQRQACHPGK